VKIYLNAKGEIWFINNQFHINSAQERLAEIIILDQLSRNMFPDTPRAFGSAGLVLTLAQQCP
jgi:uncharacterized protein (DUF924 family)